MDKFKFTIVAAGGFMKAMRTIPVMLNVARKMEELSPSGWIINYTNPTGLVTEAVTRYTKARIAGFCSDGNKKYLTQFKFKEDII